MTNPLSLLVALSGPDPAAAPAPAEDTAPFTAALLAALQSGMVPRPQVADLVTAAPMAEAPADQQADENPGSSEDQGNAHAASQERPKAAATPRPASVGGPAAVGRDAADEVGAIPIPLATGSTATGDADLPAPSPADPAALASSSVPPRADRQAGTEVETGAAPSDHPNGSIAIPDLREATSDSEAGVCTRECAPLPGKAVRHAVGRPVPDQSAPRRAAAVGTADPAVEGAARRGRTPQARRTEVRGEGGDLNDPRPEMNMVPVSTTGSVTVPIAIPAAPGGPTSSDPVAAMDGEAIHDSERYGAGQPAPGNRPPTPPASEAVGAGSVSRSPAMAHATVLTDARFVEAVAKILGDAELTGIRIILGRPVVGSVARTGSPATGAAPSIPGSGNESAPVVAGRTPVSLPRRIGGTTPDAGVDVERITARTVPDLGAAPRATRSGSPSIPPGPLPLVEPVSSGATNPAPERNLPASRQDLPAPVARVAREAEPAGSDGRIESTGPSDGWAGISIGSPGSSEAVTRGELGTRESAAGEARNLPGGKETQERPAGIADRITLQIADADGRTTRIRVAVLGDQVRAVIQPHDGEAAMHLERRMDELQQALVRQGFVDSKVTVQAAATRAEAAPPWGSAPAAGPSDPPASRGTDQPPGDQRQGSGRRESGRDGDGHRHPQHHNRERDPQGRRR